MPLPGQPPASPALRQALQLLAAGKPAVGEQVVVAAARKAKAAHGSGSPPLARAYADMARFHHRAGDFKRAAAEFKHAGGGPLPPDPAGRRDRLAFMSGYAGCLDALGQFAEAEKVFRQCVAFARNLSGPDSPGFAASLLPLADLLTRTGNPAEGARLAEEAFEVCWRHGDAGIGAAAAARAAAWKAAGRPGDAFADLHELPDDFAAGVVAAVVGQDGGKYLPEERRAVLADLVGFAGRRFGDAHPAAADALAAAFHHETSLGEGGDEKVRAEMVRRAVWGYALKRAPAGLLARVEVGFRPDGSIHLVPHLTRDPDANEAVHLESVLTAAVDDLYARPAKGEG
jgi:tetratricopeptide (TPR) repeat protein